MKENYLPIFFDNMCSSGFLPHVTVPTRFATYSCSLLDQIYIKTPRGHEDIHNIKTSSGVMISNISDHLPCFTSICIKLIKTTKHSKCITLNNLNETAISKFKDGRQLVNLFFLASVSLLHTHSAINLCA